jgi:hypothetical protein
MKNLKLFNKCLKKVKSSAISSKKKYGTFWHFSALFGTFWHFLALFTIGVPRFQTLSSTHFVYISNEMKYIFQGRFL